MVRMLAAALVSVTFALLPVATGSAAPVTVTATAVEGIPHVTWTEPDGYPGVYVDYVEVASAPGLDAYGFFLLENVVDYDYFATAEDSTGVWQGTEALAPGTYYVHVEVYDSVGDVESASPQTEWSEVVSFTVTAPSSTGDQPPPEAPAQPTQPEQPTSPTAPSSPPSLTPLPGEGTSSAAEERPRYQVRLRVSRTALVLALRDVTQGDDAIRRYRVCWTTTDAVACAARRIVAGSWDELRVRLRPGIGRLREDGKRVVEIAWYVGGAQVATRRQVIRAARR